MAIFLVQDTINGDETYVRDVETDVGDVETDENIFSYLSHFELWPRDHSRHLLVQITVNGDEIDVGDVEIDVGDVKTHY